MNNDFLRGFVKFSCGCQGIQVDALRVILWDCVYSAHCFKPSASTYEGETGVERLLTLEEIETLRKEIVTLISDGRKHRIIKNLFGLVDAEGK